jgi:hypothetical protein
MVTAKQAGTGLGFCALCVAAALTWVQSPSAFSDIDPMSTQTPESEDTSAPISVTSYMMLGILGVWASPELESNDQAE